VLSVLFRYTDSDYPFGIFKLFLDNYVVLPCCCVLSQLHIENIKWRLRFNYLVFVCPYMVIVVMSMLAYVGMRSSSLLISTKILLTLLLCFISVAIYLFVCHTDLRDA
jgi:Mn2+/Fe2+ NRAMP family transporter